MTDLPEATACTAALTVAPQVLGRLAEFDPREDNNVYLPGEIGTLF